MLHLPESVVWLRLGLKEEKEGMYLRGFNVMFWYFFDRPLIKLAHHCQQTLFKASQQGDP
jgi:hypothetical protein